MTSISVIIPTFNRSVLLQKTVRSLIDQSFSNWECIIIDDGSNNEELLKNKEIVANDLRLHFHKREAEIQGPSSCRNEGLVRANGKYIQFFDDDDVMYPEMLQKKLSKIEKCNADIVVAPMDFFEVSSQKITHQNNILSEDVIESYVLGKISWYVSGPLWKKEFLTEHFDEKIQTLDDWDFNLRNLYNKPKMGFIEYPLQKYNRYGREKTLSTKKISEGTDQSRSVFLVYKKHYNILADKNILTAELTNCLIARIVFILRQSLVRKNKISGDIFDFLMDKKKDLNKTKLLKIIVGFYSFKFFKKGYRFLKY